MRMCCAELAFPRFPPASTQTALTRASSTKMTSSHRKQKNCETLKRCEAHLSTRLKSATEGPVTQRSLGVTLHVALLLR